jgi:AcrR family transcriptional regulator
VPEYSGSGDPRRTIELLWGVRRPRRGPKPRYQVDDITRVAIGIADRDGLGGLSMRRVAEELDITAMSLYGYVPGKAELLDLMVDRVYGEPAGPVDRADGRPAGPVDRAGPGWRAALEGLARAGWRRHLAHPWLLQVATSRPILGPNTTAVYDRQLAAIDGLGLSDVEMDLLVSLIDSYVNGAARAAVEAAQAERLTGMSELEWWERYGPLLAEVLDPARYPTAVRVGAAAGAEYEAAHDPARSFEFGLQLILDSIEAFVARARG